MAEIQRHISLQSIDSPEGSILRRELAALKAPIISRDIRLEPVAPKEIAGLESRPEYTPHILVMEARQLGASPKQAPFLSFAEHIYTSNEFLKTFEDFIRGKMVDVEAVGIEDTPPESRTYFSTNFTGIPVNVARYTRTARTDNITHVEMADVPKSVDYSNPWTLRMVPPAIMEAKLLEIEKASNFTTLARIFDGAIFTSLVGHESRIGSKSHTSSHTVFRDDEQFEHLRA